MSAALQAETTRLLAAFRAAGADEVDAECLQPAETLLDLYGEDIRARAYVTSDPVQGEMMLRPDFTVPVVQMHMRAGRAPARYTYAGPVWRKQQPGSDRKPEYPQVGYEVFGGDSAQADAEVFALIATALRDFPVRPLTGDISLIFAAIDALDTNERRKAALRRHVWRPVRFARLLKRYSNPAVPSDGRAKFLAAFEAGTLSQYLEGSAKNIGLRDLAEIEARAAVLLAEQSAAPISESDCMMITAVLELSCSMGDAAENLRGIAPQLSAAAARLDARSRAMEQAGIDIHTLPFATNFGRTTMEYYDGFVFGFSVPDRPDLPQIAQGGRYDALTRVLGNGRGVPAVGAIVRPEGLVSLKGGAL